MYHVGGRKAAALPEDADTILEDGANFHKNAKLNGVVLQRVNMCTTCSMCVANLILDRNFSEGRIGVFWSDYLHHD